jgi:pyrroloquinoline quinone biosynthesis protein E
MNVPLSLIAELTHRCPLHCVYCSNPLKLSAERDELTTEQWGRVFHEAAGLGVLQLSLTGGEPLARRDIVKLVRAAREANLYVNLITSAIGLDGARLDSLIAAGLDHIQLSFQDSDEEAANEIAGARSHARKLAIASEIRKRKLAFTVNAVVHRKNLGRLEEIIAMAEELGAQRLEIANVQYYGWALANRAALLPTREQVGRSIEIVRAAQQRLADTMTIDFVAPDYHARYPKACMGGWASRAVLITPAGKALPCHAAEVIPSLEFPSVREKSLRWIWNDSPAFNKFRGEDWMQEPCRSCERRTIDFGGCRCQAFLLAADAAGADPVCTLSPQHAMIEAAIAGSANPEWIYREPKAPAKKQALVSLAI